jgi:hypothetical protein
MNTAIINHHFCTGYSRSTGGCFDIYDRSRAPTSISGSHVMFCVQLLGQLQVQTLRNAVLRFEL